MIEQTNILGLDNPDQFTCRIYAYSQSHSILYILATFEKQKFYIVFEPVLYLELPTSWQGANLCQKDQEECKTLLIRINRYEKLYFFEDVGIKLFTFDATSPINIVAIKVAQFTEPPVLVGQPYIK